ncbi:hypothetical protein PMAC_000950 [Pneumocystis sp. 'macacae']|nr:hypothetical protein PMAC_000950 [Pneumocystis sp. 'macacae']
MTFIETFSLISPINKCICLKSKKRNQDALELLKAKTFIIPIMNSRGWKIGTLAEFFPKNKALLGLNINKGSKICIRLRTCNDENIFYPLDYLIEIMLHEYYEKDSYLRSYRFDNYTSYNVTFQKFDALDKKSSIFTSCNGLRLGGNENIENKNLRDLIRDAAEKRIKKLKWCGSDSCIMIKDKETLKNSKEKTFGSKSFQKEMVSEIQWSCSLCAFKNNINYLQCKLCLSERFNISESLNKRWECSLCLCINQKNQCSCEFCNAIRA